MKKHETKKHEMKKQKQKQKQKRRRKKMQWWRACVSGDEPLASLQLRTGRIHERRSDGQVRTMSAVQGARARMERVA
jgi:hypothetical protein